MKNIFELKQERASKIAQMSTLVDTVMAENRAKDEAEVTVWNNLDKEVISLDETIRMAERQEELNKNTGKAVEVRTEAKLPVAIEFRNWLKDSVEKGITAPFNGLGELRADPLLSTTNTAIINKTVAPNVDIVTSPGEAFLRTLGVTFYDGLTGNFVLPSMDEDSATFPGEDASAASANMTPTSITLAGRRLTHTQSISVETLNQTNAGVYNSILQNLNNGIWKAVVADLFDQIDVDAATQKSAFGGTTLDYAKIVQQEASLGGFVGSNAYVTTPSVKAFLKKTAGLTNQDAIWSDNEVNGYPAFSAPQVNAGTIYFGDWTKAVVGSFQGIQLIVDPYTDAKKGLINLTVIGMFDTGCANKRAFNILTDASIG
jgi:HK97 family phage major capsid protein